MDFDFTTETITPDSTNLLTIGGTGGFELPIGTTLQRPVTGLANGALRYNTDISLIEGYVNGSWTPISTGATTITLTGDVTGSGTSSIATTLATVNSNVGQFAVTTVNAKGLVTAATTLTGDATSSGAALTLATVNGSPVSNAFVKITNNGKGLVTATTAVGSSDITTALGYTPVNRAGDTMTGNLVMSGATVTGLPTPVAGTDAANKNYVDASIAGLSWKQAVRAATTVAGTLATSFANGQVIDGVTLATNDRILIKNQATQTENGIYIVAASGAPTRSTDANTGASLVGATVYVDQGTANADTGWTQITNAPITIGTSNIVWVQFSGSGSYAAGTGISITGNTISNTGVLSNIAGTGIGVSGATGNVTITNNGVVSIAGTAGNITASAATGAVTLNLATAGTAGTYGTITTDAFGRVTSGVVVSLPANGGTGTGTAPTAGQIPIGVTGGTYTPATLTQGTGITITNATGSVTIANAGVLTFNGSTTGLTPNTATAGAITLGGTLVLANGGTSSNLTAINGGVVYSTASAMAITAAGTSGQYLKSNGAAAPTWVTLVNGGLQLYAENPSTPTAPTATGTNSVAYGSAAAASISGTKAFANGAFVTAGDAQEIQGVLRNITTNTATPTELYLDGAGASQRLVLASNTTWTYIIKLSARRTDATGSYGSWIFQGVINRDVAASTTVIPLGGVSKTTINRLTGFVAASDPTVTADTTNGSLKVTVIGSATQTIRWVASVQLSQVTN